VWGHALIRDEISVICNLDDDGQRFRKAYERIREHGNDFFKQTIGYVEDCDVYPEDRDGILGYVLDARWGTDFSNPEEDFEVPNPRCSRSSARVRDGVPLVLKSKPKGLVALVGEELIFHSDLLKVIHGPSLQGMGEVIVQGTKMADWHRVMPRNVQPIVDPNSWKSGFCVRCRLPCTFPTALWFGKAEAPLEQTVFNDVGMGHLSKRAVVVVPKSLREKLVGKGKRLQYKGVLFNRLYSKNSSRFKVVSLINELTAHLPTSREALPNI
jgi:hypothetical protein